MKRRSPSSTHTLLWLVALVAGTLTFAGTAGASGTGPASSELSLVVEPTAGMAPIYKVLASPKRTLDMVMYELDDRTAESILADDAARGVDVRVLLDRAEIGDVNDRARSFLLAHGVAVRWASGRYELTHEKSVVVDDRTALVMTLNLGPSEYESADRDFAVLDRRPADVAAMDATFSADWRGVPVSPPAGQDLLWSPGAEGAIVALIASARSSVLLESEEMADPIVEGVLERAAARGVKVTVVMADAPQWSSALGRLAHAGVEVRVYPDTATALYIHAKAIAVDTGHADARVFVGSQNLSYVSLAFNRELGIVTSDPAIVEGVEHVVADDAQRGTPFN